MKATSSPNIQKSRSRVFYNFHQRKLIPGGGALVDAGAVTRLRCLAWWCGLYLHCPLVVLMFVLVGPDCPQS